MKCKILDTQGFLKTTFPLLFLIMCVGGSALQFSSLCASQVFLTRGQPCLERLLSSDLYFCSPQRSESLAVLKLELRQLRAT